MTIWLLAVLLMASVSLAGWRQGAIRAAFAFIGIIFAALLAVPLGHLVRPLLPHFGVTNPLTVWALAPIVGFILGSIPLKVAGYQVHKRVEHFYKYKGSELQSALYERLNVRLGICVGLLNGAAYFVLVTFFIFNLAYWTTQIGQPTNQPMLVRLVNQMGWDLQSTGFAKTASAVGTLPENYYRLADLSGLLLQNPKLGSRLGDYPGLTSLWQREDLQPLLTDPNLTNALASGASLSELESAPAVQSLLENKQLTKVILTAVTNQYDDLTNYLQTGKSSRYAGEKILGDWNFNGSVTLAWFRQEQQKMPAAEMRGIRALWSQAYAQTTLLFTGDNQVFVKNYPKFVQPQGNEPPFQMQNWKGDWTRDGTNYSLHLTQNGEDKYLTGTTDGVRMTLRDGRSSLIFDRAD